MNRLIAALAAALLTLTALAAPVAASPVTADRAQWTACVSAPAPLLAGAPTPDGGFVEYRRCATLQLQRDLADDDPVETAPTYQCSMHLIGEERRYRFADGTATDWTATPTTPATLSAMTVACGHPGLYTATSGPGPLLTGGPEPLDRSRGDVVCVTGTVRWSNDGQRLTFGTFDQCIGGSPF